MSAGAVKALLARHGLAPNRDLGQNFLVDETLASRLATLAGVEDGDCVIEIGAGLGALTRALAARARRVVAVELDAGVVRALRADGELPANVELIHADALRIDLGKLATFEDADAKPARGAVRLVANLPYHTSAPLLRRILDLRGLLTDWSVMLQTEVAVRLLAAPGTRDYGSLAVLHRLTVHAERLMDLSPNCFFPVPKVNSTFVRLTPLPEPMLRADELPRTEAILRAAFAKRRKTILNSLKSGELAGHTGDSLTAALVEADIDPRARAESVEPARLLSLARALDAGS